MLIWINIFWYMSIDWFALNLFYGIFNYELYFTIIPIIMESSLDVKEKYFSPTTDREVTLDHHQAARRENNSNWCHLAKYKNRVKWSQFMFGSCHQAKCIQMELYWSSKQSKNSKKRHKCKTNSRI